MLHQLRETFKSTKWKEQMIFVFDPLCQYLYVNEKAIESFQRKEEDFIGNKITDLYPEVTGTRNHKNLLRAIGGQHVHDIIKSSNGRRMEVDYKPIGIEGKTEIAYVIVRATPLGKTT